MTEGNSRRTAAPDGAESNVMRCLLQPFAADPHWYRRYWYSDRRGSAAAAAARPPARRDRPDGAADASWQVASASRIAVTLVLLVGIMAAASASYLLR